MTQNNQPLLNNKIVTITEHGSMVLFVQGVFSLRPLSETLLWKIIMHNY